MYVERPTGFRRASAVEPEHLAQALNRAWVKFHVGVVTCRQPLPIVCKTPMPLRGRCPPYRVNFRGELGTTHWNGLHRDLRAMKRQYGLLLFILLAGCGQQPAEFHHTILEFDTLINVTLYDVDEQVAKRAFADLDQQFAHYQSSWTPYEPSDLTQINQAIAAGETVRVAPSVLPLIARSIPLAEQTGNLYNPAIGKLIKLWQFHRHDEPDIRPPDPDRIAALVGADPKLADLALQSNELHCDNPQVELNFGAFAKGYAVDTAMRWLREMGIRNAIFAVGGDVKALGRHGDRAWRVGIRHPRQDTVMATLDLQGEEGVSTSGDYERYFFYQGKRYHHILDPRTGYPAQGTQAVTVVHRDSGLADVAATALFIAGPQHWLELARKLKLTLVFFVDGDGQVQVTPELMERLKFNPAIPTSIHVTPPL
jgi:thiamine biosynthesis lipoprotein